MAVRFFFSSRKFALAAIFALFLADSLVVLCQMSGAASASEGGVPEPAIAFAGRVIGDDSRSRLILDFDRKVRYETYILDNPKRVIVDLSRTVFALNDEAQVVADSLVESWRHGRISEETSRLVLNLASSARVENATLRVRGKKGRQRLIVDLVSVEDTEFSKITRKASIQATELDGQASGSEQSKERKFVIVIDPGHGGIDGGAIGPHRVREKTVTLNFAQRLLKRLTGIPGIEIVMTRNDDKFVSLTDRLETAHDVKADLLISIHADSLRQKYIRGATVYTLSRKGSDSISRMLARDQNRADLIAGLALPEVEDDVGDILIDLTRRETKAFSKRFASLLVKEMNGRVKMIRNPHRSADFYVLKAPEIPSVLLELGYLSNDQDEKLLNSGKWQNMVVERIAVAIRSFFATRLAARHEK